jgi:hypothetical protein
MTNLKFYEIQDIDEIDNLMEEYILSKGWKYDEDHLGNSVVDLKITDPSGKEWSLEQCANILNQPIRCGDKNQINALKAVEFYNLLYNWGYQDREQLEQQGFL